LTSLYRLCELMAPEVLASLDCGEEIGSLALRIGGIGHAARVAEGPLRSSTVPP
jgi:hypothetical protein